MRERQAVRKAKPATESGGLREGMRMVTTPVTSEARTARRRVQIALALLLGVYMLNFVDRQIVNILAEPMAKELGLSDTQIGLMTGLSFALIYTVLGLPLARYADRASTNRVGLISICIAVWSAMTAMGAFAQSFTHMLLARIGVGAGEAGCTPAATTLIADLVPERQRARAMAIFGLGVPLGSLLGLVIGGVVSDHYGWRAALLLVGAPGLLLALVFWRLAEEPRLAQAVHDTTPPPERLPLGEVLREIAASRAFRWIVIGSCFSAFFSYGKGVWQIIYLIRSHGLSAGQVGLGLGISGGILGACGTWAGGWLGDRLGMKDPRHYFAAPILGGLASLPLFVVAYTTDNAVVALLCIAVPAFLHNLGFAPTYAAIQGLVRPQSRATAVSIKLFLQTLIGMGLGPLLFGMISDAIKPVAGAESVRWVLLSAVSLLCVSVFADWRTGVNLGRELRNRTTRP